MVQMQEGQVATARVTPRSKRGKPARIEEGSAKWESSDEDVATVEPSAESPLVAKIRAEGEGECLITFSADGHPGEGVKEIIGTTSVAVTGADAVAFDLSVSEATDEEDETAAQGGGGSPAPSGGDDAAQLQADADAQTGGAAGGTDADAGGAPPTALPVSGEPSGSSVTGGGVEEAASGEEE